MPQPSKGPSWARRQEPKGPVEQISEFKDLVVGYAKQETVDPLKSLGRSLGYGVVGSVMLGTGLLLLLLALLRGLESIEVLNDPTMTTGGTWGWVPYAATLLAGLILVLIFLSKLIKAVNEGSRRGEARSARTS